MSISFWFQDLFLACVNFKVEKVKLQWDYFCIWLSRSEQDKEPEAEASSDVVGDGPSEEAVADAPQEIDEYLNELFFIK